MTAVAVVLAVVLAAAHVLAGRMRFDAIPRSKWMSVAGGVSVSYVFIQLLPELAAAAEEIEGGLAAALGRPVYVLALLGLALFYGIERFSRGTRKERRDRGQSDEAAQVVTWFSFAIYSLYNAVIGYVLVREHETVAAVSLFALAMGLHFVINDHSLREHHKDDYHRAGRWVIAGAILLGAAVGLVTEVEAAVIGALIAFIAGGVILNVMKEELPEERESSFGAFAAGAAGYTALLLAI